MTNRFHLNGNFPSIKIALWRISMPLTPHAKIGSRQKRGWGGDMGGVVTSRTFFSPFSSLNARTAYPENYGLTLNAPNDVFPCRLVS